MGQYEKHLKYRLSCVRGNMFSYERVRPEIRDRITRLPYPSLTTAATTTTHIQEFFDICRAAMLKYWYQVRIGKMHGIFVCYHNTQGTVRQMSRQVF
jgi:hypothetical protein